MEILFHNIFCFHFVLQNWLQNGQKVREIQIFFKKSRQISIKSRFISTKSRFLTNISICLDWSQFVSTISIFLDDLDKYLDKNKSRPKNLDFKNLNFKNLDRDKIKIDLDVMDNLNGFQKLVSTQWTFSISISIGLECRDPQA